MLKKIIIRALKIYLIAMLLNFVVDALEFAMAPSDYPQDTGILQHAVNRIRYTGVLHRIAIVFLVSGILFLYTKVRTQILICIFILVGYFTVMMVIPPPGEDKVTFERGTTFASWVDSKILPKIVWWNADHHGMTWTEWRALHPRVRTLNPEGVMSTVPAISSCLIGVLMGLLLLDKQRYQERKLIILFSAGALMLGASYFADMIFPINKSVWTSSYVLFSSGFACMVLALAIYFVDILGYKKYAYIGIVFGCNAITMYCVADTLSPFFFSGLNHTVVDAFVALGASPAFSSMTYSLIFVAINFIPAWILYKKKIFIRL